jgi:hypothetical protein
MFRQLLQRRSKALDQLAPAYVTKAQQVVARCHFHEHGNVAPGRNRHHDERHGDSQDLRRGYVKPEAVVLARFVPALQVDDELDPLRCSCRRHAKEVGHIDQPQSPNLDMVTRQLGTRSDEDGFT